MPAIIITYVQCVKIIDEILLKIIDVLSVKNFSTERVFRNHFFKNPHFIEIKLRSVEIK